MAKKKYEHKRYSHKEIKKNMKQDELRNVLGKTFTYFKGNTENTLIAAVIVIVLMILIPLYFKSRADNDQRANGMFNRCLSYSRMAVDVKLAEPSSEAFRSVEEKYKKTRETYAEISNNYRDSRVADQAKVGEANACFFMKDYGKALGLYQEGLAHQQDAAITATLQERIGACQENLKKWQEALQTYQGILQKNPDYFNRRSVRLGEARCFWNLKKITESKQIMQAEASQTPGYWTETARQQQLFLETASK